MSKHLKIDKEVICCAECYYYYDDYDCGETQSYCWCDCLEIERSLDNEDEYAIGNTFYPEKSIHHSCPLPDFIEGKEAKNE